MDRRRARRGRWGRRRPPWPWSFRRGEGRPRAPAWDRTLRPPGPLSPSRARLPSRPGNFISLAVGADADGNPILRSSSLASSPGDTQIVLIVKLIPGGTASTWFERLAVGDRLRFTGPMGFFVCDLSHAG